MIAKRAWLYCRVENGWDWDSYEFMELQKDSLKQFCQEHDLEVSGTTTAIGNTISELEQVVNCGIAQDTFDVLVVTSSILIGRSLTDLFRITEQLAAPGKGLCMVQDNISTIQISGFAPLNLEDMP